VGIAQHYCGPLIQLQSDMWFVEILNCVIAMPMTFSVITAIFP